MDGDLARQIAAARRGDGKALDTLFARHLPPLVAFIRARTGKVVAARESALDLAQSVCREVLQDAEHIELRDEGAFRNWLFMAATRKVLDRARYHQRERRDVGRERPMADAAAESEAALAGYATMATPSRHAAAREELARLERAVQELPADQREAVVMSRLLHLGYAQIAEQLGRTESSVRGLVARGLAALAERLGDTDAG